MTDEDGLLIGNVTLNKMDDYREGAWLIPAGGVEKEPPKDKDGYVLRWNGKKWDYCKIELAEDEEVQSQEAICTSEMLLDRLNSEFAIEKQELLEAFATAQIKSNVQLQQEIRSELTELEKDYDAKMALIEQGKNPWEDEAES